MREMPRQPGSAQATAEALTSDEKLEAFLAEVGRLLDDRPEDKKHILEALSEAERLLGLDHDGIDWKETPKMILNSAIGAGTGLFIAALIFPPLWGIVVPATGVLSAGFGAYSELERQRIKKEAVQRLAMARAVLTGKSRRT